MTYFNALTGQYETIADGLQGGSLLQYVPAPANYTPVPPMWFDTSQILLSTTINRVYQFTNDIEGFRRAFLYHNLDLYLRGGLFYYKGTTQTSPEFRSELESIFKGGVRLEIRNAPTDLRQTGGAIHARIKHGGQIYTPFIMLNPYNKLGFYPELVNGVWNVGNGVRWGVN